MKRARLLIVDDELPMRMALAQIFKREYAITLADNGAEAVNAFRLCRPDLVLMDIYMSKLGGIAALQQIKRIDTRVPVIMVTVADKVRQAVQSMRLGATDYITKPFSIREIKRIVETALQRRAFTAPFICENPETRRIVARAREAIRSGKNLALLGQPGVGKTALLRKFHSDAGYSAASLVEVCLGPQDLPRLQNSPFEAWCAPLATEQGGTLVLSVKKTVLAQFLARVQLLGLQMIPAELRSLKRKICQHTKVSKNKILLALELQTNTLLEESFVPKSMGWDDEAGTALFTLKSLECRPEDVEALARHFWLKYVNAFGKDAVFPPENIFRKLVQYKFHGNANLIKTIVRDEVCRAV